MKLFVSMAYLLGSALAMAGDEGFLKALRSYKENVKPEAPADLKLALADDLLKEWGALDEANRIRFEGHVSTIHFLKAELLVSKGEYKEAVQELLAELKMSPKIEYSTKNPDFFFVRLVELQACLTAETGADPLAGAVDYLFEKEGESFKAARIELYEEVHQFTVPLVEGEKLAVVHQITKNNGKFEVTSTTWLVVPEGKIRDVLKKARREITFDKDGRMIIRELK